MTVHPLSPDDIRPVRESEMAEAYSAGLNESAAHGRILDWQEISDFLQERGFSTPLVIRTIALLKVIDDWRDAEKPAPSRKVLVCGLRRAANDPLDLSTGEFLYPSDIFRS